MPISATVRDIWTTGLGHKGGAFLAAERVAWEQVLPGLGFQFLIWFTQLNIRKGFKARNYIYDFFGEKDGQKWLIEVTSAKQKHLDQAMMRVFLRMGIEHFGVLFITKDLTRYFFKEVPSERIIKGAANIVLRVTLVDLAYKALGQVPPLPQKALAASWQTQ